MNTPLRTAVIGFGTAGAVFHAPFIATSPRFSLDVVVTGDPQRAEDARRYTGVTVCSSVEEMFGRAAELDLVVIASPPGTHGPLAHRAIDLGLAVVVDKPMSPSAADSRDLVEHAERAGVPLTVFQNRRWDGDFLTVRSLLERGDLGDVRRFESRFEWWKPEVAKDWKRETRPDQGGGILYDLGTHLLDQALVLFGRVESVHAELASYRVPGIDDDAFVSLWHANGVRTQLWMNGMAAQVGPRFHVLGSAAGYTSWGLDGQESALKSGAAPTEAGFGQTPEAGWGSLGIDGSLVPVPTQPGSYVTFYDLLADALLEGAPLPVDPRDPVAVLEIIETIHRDTHIRG